MKKETEFNPVAAILDMDGLILDTEKPIIPLWIKAGKSLGFDLDPEIISCTIGMNNPTTKQFLKQELGPDYPVDLILEALHRLIIQEFEKGISLKTGLIQLMDHLASRSIAVAVATSSNREEAIWKLQIAKVLDRFPVIVCGDEIKNGKPAPDIFLLAAEKLGYPPSHCIGFEDSVAGLKGLHAAGIRSVFIKDIVEPSAEILATVWRRLNDLSEAISLFN